MESASLIRFSAFAAVFLIMALWEVLSQRRPRVDARLRRWRQNLGIVLIDSLLVRLAAPAIPVAVALFAEANGWGLLNAFALPAALEWIVTLLVLDLIIYMQHVMFHSVPVLWRLHMVHHADLDIDVTTGLRFHPVEILISLGIKIAAVAAFGLPAAPVVAFEIILNATAMFNHSNVFMPVGVDKWLRRLLVTPDMHRVHHSVAVRETNSNFGFCLSWWDRLLGTYKAQPDRGHQQMRIGISHIRKPLTFLQVLLLPVTHPPGAYPINAYGRGAGENPNDPGK